MAGWIFMPEPNLNQTEIILDYLKFLFTIVDRAINGNV